MRQGFRRGTIEHHSPVPEQDRSLCLIRNSLQVMGGPHAGCSRLVDDLSNPLTQFMGGDRIEPGGGFIQEQKCRLEDQESRESHPPLLPKAEGMTRPSNELPYAERLRHLPSSARCSIGIHSPAQQSPGNVFSHCTRDEVVLWILSQKHHAAIQAVTESCTRDEVLPEPPQLPLRRSIQSCQKAK